jgi:cation transport protein ChaC
VYIGPPNGPQFLGEASVKDIAHQIANTSGPSGPNSEYVFKLSNCMRELFPDVQDDHLFSVEKELIMKLNKE